MKKTLSMVCAALVALVSCEKHPAGLNSGPVTFDLQASYQGGSETKSVKSGWEDGDVIYVVFSGVESPNYLKMKYEDGTWVETQMSSKYEGTLPLSEGDEGTMTAIFLPFAAEETYIYDAGQSFTYKFTRFMGKGDAQTATTSTPRTMYTSATTGRRLCV